MRLISVKVGPLTAGLPGGPSELSRSSNPLALRRVALLLIVIAVSWSGYHAWAYYSDGSARTVFAASSSCGPLTTDSTEHVAAGACRREFAIVVEKKRYGNETHRLSSWKYSLSTISADGTVDRENLSSYNAAEFWQRVVPEQRIVLQRFVAPGYSLTGKVTAFADTAGSVTTGSSPRSASRGHGPFAILGVGTFLFALLFYRLSLVAAPEVTIRG